VSATYRTATCAPHVGPAATVGAGSWIASNGQGRHVSVPAPARMSMAETLIGGACHAEWISPVASHHRRYWPAIMDTIKTDQSLAVRRLLAWFLPPGEAGQKGVETEQESALVIGVPGEARRFDDERQVADVELC